MLKIIRQPDQRISETFEILDLHLIAHNNAITWEIVIFLNGIMSDITKEENVWENCPVFWQAHPYNNPSHE